MKKTLGARLPVKVAFYCFFCGVLFGWVLALSGETQNVDLAGTPLLGVAKGPVLTFGRSSTPMPRQYIVVAGYVKLGCERGYKCW